jgi:sugar/nucleoside kinase (ribokinase family)
LAEAKVIADALERDTTQRRDFDESVVPQSVSNSDIRRIASIMAAHFDKVIFKMGRSGVLLSQKCAETQSVRWDHLEPSVVKSSAVSVTGAGDSLVGAICSGVALHPETVPKDLVRFASIVKSSMTASELSLDTSRAVSELLGPDIFKLLK